MTRTCVGNMSDETAMLRVLVCPITGCTLGNGGARWRTPPLSENGAMRYMERHRAAVHGQQIDGVGGEACDDGVGEAVQDEGEEKHLSEWSRPDLRLQDIPRPVLQRRCTQEDFNIFRRGWLRYVRYYEKVDDSEIRNELMNCLDATIQIVVYNAFNRSFDNTTPAALLWEIEMLVVEDVEKYVDLTKVYGVRCTNIADGQLEVEVDEEHTVEMVGTDMRLVRVPSTKVQPSDDHSFEVNTDRDIVKEYATLHSEGNPSKPVTSNVTRRARRARQRSVKYETTAAMVMVDEEQAVMGVPKVVGKDMMRLSNGKCGGQEGGARNKIVPKTFVNCEEPFCQFNMELEDEISAKRVLQNHMFVAHKRQEQNHKQKLCGRDGGQEGGAKMKIPKSDPYHKQGGQHHMLETSGNDGGRRRGAKNKIVPIMNPPSGGGGPMDNLINPMQETNVRETEKNCKYGEKKDHESSPSLVKDEESEVPEDQVLVRLVQQRLVQEKLEQHSLESDVTEMTKTSVNMIGISIITRERKI